MKSPILSIKNVFKTYTVGDQKINALNGVSIDIFQGDFVAIVGKSGSGKSTLMHIIGLLDTPSSGDVVINGTNVSKMDEASLAKIRNKEIGFVFQSFNLLSRATALENVLLPLQYSSVPKENWENLALKMLKMVDLQERIQNRSNELSGGQKQRVAIARALVTDPAIILADEPTGNLDSKTGAEIVKKFIELNNSGRTIVLVTHDSDLAKIAKKIFVLSDGEIIKEEK
ncbi:MAG: ABC transporter ATP-binding protein [Proteobacteria bacterium]|nr:ABC transporter ATP-binding protein [Pseudomonadota bacterium]